MAKLQEDRMELRDAHGWRRDDTLASLFASTGGLRWQAAHPSDVDSVKETLTEEDRSKVRELYTINGMVARRERYRANAQKHGEATLPIDEWEGPDINDPWRSLDLAVNPCQVYYD